MTGNNGAPVVFCVSQRRMPIDRLLMLTPSRGSVMLAAQVSDFIVGRTLEIVFDDFKPRITFHPDQRLTVQIIAGDNAGFADTVRYEAVWFSDSILVLSWQERIGGTVVHVLDLSSAEAYTLITPAKGGFMRLEGRIKWSRHSVDPPPRRVDALAPS
jgi:hypothetical protein